MKKKTKKKVVKISARGGSPARGGHGASGGKKFKTRPKAKAERFMLNESFEFFSELRSLVLKSSVGEKEKMIKKVSNLGRIRLAIISGIFLSDPDSINQYDAPADLFIVGDEINRAKLRNFLGSLEAEIGTEIKFTLMDKEEFDYRFNMFDRFVRVLLEGPHEKIVNKIGL